MTGSATEQHPRLPCSVLIIVHGRTTALMNVLTGLAAGTVWPTETVICFMNQPPLTDWPSLPFDLITCRVDGPPGQLPLAAARNRAAAQARCDTLLFLDVDCIPGPETVERLTRHSQRHSGLVMAAVYYLPRDAVPVPLDLELLPDRSMAHPRRPLPTGDQCRSSDDYGLFWSLGFTVQRPIFTELEGFDEGFVGYGAEDTDLAFRARERKVALWLSSAPVYHQYHPVYRPPLNHFEAIVANAGRFSRKWGQWPMTGWLSEFASRGYIDWSPKAAAISVHPTPTDSEVHGVMSDSGTAFPSALSIRFSNRR